MAIKREGFILFGLLMGGDYDNKVCAYIILGYMLTDTNTPTKQKGLRGCGSDTALALASSGLGESLCAAARSASGNELQSYLVGWREQVRLFLRTNPQQSMQSRHPALAASISDTFPDISILHLYLFPITSSNSCMQNALLDTWMPDPVEITHLCELYFPWATRQGIINKFETGVFQAMLVAALKQEILSQTLVQEPHMSAHAIQVRIVCRFLLNR